MPQNDHGTADGFSDLAPGHQDFKPSVWGPCQGLGGRREGGQCAHSALDAKVVAMLEMLVTSTLDPEYQDGRN